LEDVTTTQINLEGEDIIEKNLEKNKWVASRIIYPAQS